MSRAHIKRARSWPDFADTIPVIHETRHVQNVVLENQQFKQQRDTTAKRAERFMLRVVAPLALIVVGCALLTGCGGGGGSEGQHPQQALSAPPAAERHAAIVFGDSTFTAYYQGEQSTPEIAAQILGRSIDNQAVQGSKAYEVDLSLICKSQAPVVVDNHAINDSTTEPVEVYRAAITAIVETARACGKRTVLMQANAILTEGLVNESRTEAGVSSYDLVKAEVAAATGAIYCRRPGIVWTRSEVPDGIHPGAAVKPAIAQALAACIKGVL